MQSSIHSWPRLVESFAEIPEAFKALFRSALGEALPFPYTIYMPSDRWGRRETGERLLSASGAGLFIFEGQGREQVIGYKPEDISYVKRGAMLLHSWITVSGVVRGKPKSVVIEFNTVAEEIFEALLTMLRSESGKFEGAAGEKPSDGELSKFDQLALTNYKLMNCGRKSIIANERVEAILFQPAIYRPYFRYFKRMLCPPHLHILTDRELIMIKEDDSAVSRMKTKKYLSVWTFVPLHKIRHISVEKRQEDAVVDLTVALPQEERLESAFDASNEGKVRSLADRLNLYRRQRI